MDNPGEILRLCRLCLVKDQVNIPIFEEQGDIRQTFLKIRSCLPVKVSRDDKLPKKICGGCSNKLDLFYEFWSSTANSEKTLQSWLGQEEEDDKMQEITKPVEALVKEESEALEDGHAHDQSFDEATKDEAEAPPAKRARRTAAVKAQINISHDSDEDEDVDGAEPITKIEDESDDSDGEEKDPSYTEVPGTSADDQAGPSGLGKDGVEAPCGVPRPNEDNSKAKLVKKFYCSKCCLFFDNFRKLHDHMFQPPSVSHIFRCAHCQYIVGHTLLDVILHTKRFCSREQFRRAESEISKAHPDQSRYYCERCGQGFGVLSNLLLHYSEHKGQELCCSVCDKNANNLLELLIHYRDHTVLGNLFLQCQRCSSTFLSTTPLKMHYYTVHSQLFNIPYECIFCDNVTFDDEDGFLRHVQSHSVLNTEKASDRPRTDVSKTTCEFCAQMFDSAVAWREHRVRVHKVDGTEKRECPQCYEKILIPALSSHILGHLKEKFRMLPKNVLTSKSKEKKNMKQGSKVAIVQSNGVVENANAVCEISEESGNKASEVRLDGSKKVSIFEVESEKNSKSKDPTPVGTQEKSPNLETRLRVSTFKLKDNSISKFSEKSTQPQEEKSAVVSQLTRPHTRSEPLYCSTSTSNPPNIGLKPIQKITAETQKTDSRAHKITSEVRTTTAQKITTIAQKPISVAQKTALSAHKTTTLPTAITHQLYMISAYPQSRVKCGECGKTFLSVFALNSHEQAHVLERQLELAKQREKSRPPPISPGNTPNKGGEELNFETRSKYKVAGGSSQRRNPGQRTYYDSIRENLDQSFSRPIYNRSPSPMSQEESYLDNIDSYPVPRRRSRSRERENYYIPVRERKWSPVRWRSRSPMERETYYDDRRENRYYGEIGRYPYRGFRR
ncbi:zinc finger protein 473 homolog isoform X2 [Euwallacea similis]|uniref:zinc finger protein 473 homolog isoform X2 n=1 Tax=Euwallacea similis TaxID=1736056 RepID=UPI003451091F